MLGFPYSLWYIPRLLTQAICDAQGEARTLAIEYSTTITTLGRHGTDHILLLTMIYYASRHMACMRRYRSCHTHERLLLYRYRYSTRSSHYHPASDRCLAIGKN